MTKEEKLARKQQRKAEKVGLGKLLLWNSSSCSVALSTLMLGYVTFYCTDVLQLAPALVGTLFMVSKIFDSFTDIVAGFIVDRTQTRWGKGRPYEIFMLFLWLSTWLLFSCPTSFATAAKCIWIFCMYTFMNSICVTFLNANNVVYMVRAFENKEQQSKIVGYGSIFTMAGAMVLSKPESGREQPPSCYLQLVLTVFCPICLPEKSWNTLTRYLHQRVSAMKRIAHRRRAC